LFAAILLTEQSLAGSSKMLILLTFLMVMNPITSHLIARSARRNGIGLSDQKGED
jgi:multisubunit Na+/H+ antiporter MnhG subunit